MKKTNRMMSPHEVACQLEVPAATVRQWLRKGNLRGIKLGPRLWRIREEDLRNFIEKGWNKLEDEDRP